MTENLPAFLGAAVLVAMAPGPSTVMIMRESARSGRRAGVATVLGNEAGVLAWGVAAALGLSALLLASRLAYDVLRVAGAGVLVYFGVRALWQARRRRFTAAEPEPAAGPPEAGTWWRGFRLGALTNFANPKAGVFAVSFLPQFVPDGAPVFATLLLLSALWALVDLVWYLTIVWVIGWARRLFLRPQVRRRLEQVSGAVLVGLGVRLAADAR